MLDVEVTYRSQQATLPLIVVQGKRPSLNWMEVIRLNWSNINHVTTNFSLERILSKYPVVFQNELGLLKGTKAKMFVVVDATPRFFKPRSVSYYLKEKVEQELARFCGDYKVTANLVSKQDSFLPIATCRRSTC